MSNTINQQDVIAGGSVVSGDQTVINNYQNRASTAIGKLLQKLQGQIENNEEIQHKIDQLSKYYKPKPTDGVVGLKQKLERGGRAHEIDDAMERKEDFVKFLEEWALYSSAQEIIAIILAKIEHEFAYNIRPLFGGCDEAKVNRVVTDVIVDPLVDECGGSPLLLDHNLTMGMVYWLGEQCYVRWHK